MKQGATRVDRKDCTPVYFFVISTALGIGTPVHLLPSRGPVLSVTQPCGFELLLNTLLLLSEQLTQNSGLKLLTHLREISLINVLNLKHRLRA